MTTDIFCYTFPLCVPLDEVEETILLAVWGTEALHGSAQVRLDTGHLLDRATRACVIDAGTPAGRDLNRLFAGFLTREFGPDSFCVERPQPRHVVQTV